MKEIFYFIRDKDHKPVISICLLIETESVQARGVAICSDSETPCINIKAHQRNGPGIAKKKAWKAWKSESNDYRIHRLEAIAVLDRIRLSNEETWNDISFPEMYGFKAFYFPILSKKEERILATIK